MRTAILYLAVVHILVPYAAAEDEVDEFDVDAGYVAQLIAVPIESGTEVECRVEYDDLRFTDVYSPSFSIAFSEADSPLKNVDSQPIVRISFSIADDNGKVFWLDVMDPKGEPYKSAFLGLKEGGSEAALKLYWRDDGLFTYLGQSGGEFGNGYVLLPDIIPRFARVLVSGMKGSFSCESAVLPDDE